MTLVLRNALVTTARPIYTAGRGASIPEPYLTRLEVHIMPVTHDVYDIVGGSSLRVEYFFKMDTGIDVREGDWIINITLMDGVTPWPATLGPNEVWSVIIAIEHTPGILAYREAYIGRYVLGGPAPQ